MRTPFPMVLLMVLLSTLAAFGQEPPRTDITQADRAAWFAILQWPAELEAFYQETRFAEDDDGFMALYPVDATTSLVEVVIAPGAYQFSYLYLLYDEASGKATLLEFPWYSLDGDDEVFGRVETELVGLPTFDEETAELEIFSRWRGVGGCGTLQRYRVTADGAAHIETRAQTCQVADEAGDEMILEPWRWPVIWPPETGN